MRKKRIRKAEILRAINKIRRFRGLEELNEIPKGKMADINACPIRKAFNYLIPTQTFARIESRDFETEKAYANFSKGLASYLHWKLYGAGTCLYFKLPNYISNFIKEFDSGNLPEYEENY